MSWGYDLILRVTWPEIAKLGTQHIWYDPVKFQNSQRSNDRRGTDRQTSRPMYFIKSFFEELT